MGDRKRENVEAELSVYDGRLVVNIDLSEQALAWMLEKGSPEDIARQLWEVDEVRQWLMRLLTGEDWSITSGGTIDATHRERVAFLTAIKADVDNARLLGATHRLAAAEQYVEAYWSLWHGLQEADRHLRYQSNRPEFHGKTWEETKDWWRQHISEKLGLAA